MDVLRVFNNNVVLAKDGNREVILTGRGIGFQAKPGQHVDEAKVGSFPRTAAIPTTWRSRWPESRRRSSDWSPMP